MQNILLKTKLCLKIKINSLMGNAVVTGTAQDKRKKWMSFYLFPFLCINTKLNSVYITKFHETFAEQPNRVINKCKLFRYL